MPRTILVVFDGLAVGATVRERCLEQVTVGRTDVRDSDRTPLETDLVEYFRGRLSGERAIAWDRLRLESITEFRRRVYETVAEIPSGETVSYGELASRLGKQGAARAVGQALKANPVPIVVPCHRVTRADGRPGGYGGSDRAGVKPHLLGLEERRTD